MAVDHNNPQSRDEEILIATIDGTEYNKLPQSRMEELLLELKEVIEEGGGGGGSVHFVVVEELPTTDIDQTAIYLVPKSTAATSNVYDEYINTDGTTSGWELIGTTDIDLSDYITDDDLATVLEDYATEQDLSGKQDTLTAGKYINIGANNEIKVNPVIPNETFNYVLQQTADYTIKVTKSVNNVVVSEETYGPPTTWDAPVDVTLDEAINIYISLVGTLYYELLIASDSHEAGFKQTMSWFGRNTYTENFSTVDHTGEKLIIKSEMDTAINAIKDGQSIDSFADVETALADKQDALTAGDYISIDANNEITVNREIPSVSASYELKTTSTSDPDINTDVIKRVNGEIVWQENYNYQTVRDNPVTIDDVFVLSYSGQWKYKLLVASDDHAAGYEQTWGWSAWVDYTENFSLVDNTGKKLIIKSELDTALASKQDATDNNLDTTAKTVVGGINEINSNLTNLSADVKLNTNDLTTLSRTKNLLNANIAEAKANNTTGTWSDNSYTESGVTFACTVDNAGYITNVHVTGTATEQVSFSLTKTFTLTEDTSYLLNGCPSGGTQSKYRVTIYTSVMDTQSTYGADKDFTYKAGNNPNAYIRIYSGYECPTAGLDFTPMVRLATESDATFAPYIHSVDSRLEAVEKSITVSRITVSPDVNGYVNLASKGFPKDGFKYVNVVVTGASSTRSYDARVWLSDQYGWIVSIYTVNTFTKVTDTSVSLDLVVFGIAV